MPETNDMSLKSGYVALIDVLGFRELISQSDKESRLNQYIATARRVLKRPRIEFVLFSDTIVINSTGTGDEALADVVSACSNLLYELALTNVAIRGAIAHGAFVKSGSSADGVFIAGRPIVEAYHYETQQDWVGIMLAPSAIAASADIAKKCQLRDGSPFPSAYDYISNHPVAFYLQPFESIPFHDGEPYDGYAVVPMCADPARGRVVTESIQRMKAELVRMKAVAPDPSAQRKYARTIEWLDQKIFIKFLRALSGK